MAYDNVNYKAFCPQCGGFLTGWQSKSGPGMFDTLEVWQVRDMRAVCAGCGADVTATVDAEVEHVVKRCDVRLMVNGKNATPQDGLGKSFHDLVCVLGCAQEIAQGGAAHKRDAKDPLAASLEQHKATAESAFKARIAQIKDIVARTGAEGINRSSAELNEIADRGILAWPYSNGTENLG